MKKRKVKKFEEGGSIRERAMRYAALADNPEEQAAFQSGIHEAQQREAEMADLIRAAERRNVAKRADMGSKNEFRPKVARLLDSTDYGSEGESYGRGMRSSGISEIPRVRADEPVDIIGQVPMSERPTMMAEPPAYPRRGEMTVRESRPESVRPEMSDASVPTMDRQPMTERSVSDRFRDIFLSGGATAIPNIAGALAGPAAGRAAAATARGAAEASGSAGAQRVMEAAGRRAAQTRAERATQTAPVREILRGVQQTETARRAAETRERAIRKAQETMGRGTARTRARQAERRQDAMDEMRMGGEGGGFKKGGKVSASSRADGIAKRGKTRGRIY
jgi:hypothetical protein